MSSAYTPTPDGKPILGADVQQILNGITGVTARVHSFLNDDASYALTGRNSSGNHLRVRHSGNSYSLIDVTDTYTTVRGSMKVLSSDGLTTLLDVTDSGVTMASSGLIYRPETYGAEGDTVILASAASISSSTNTTTLTITGGNLTTANDVGKTVGVMGAGAAGACLVATISSVESSTSCTISTPALTTVSNAQIIYGHDDTAGFDAAIAAAALTGGDVELSARRYMIGNGDWANLRGVRIIGQGKPTTEVSGTGIERGSFILAKPGTTGNWIDFGANFYSQIKNVQFGRSDQGNWAVPDVGILLLAKQQECVQVHLEDVYISGSFSIATAYCGSINMSSATRCQFYNYHDTGECFALTASNRSDLTSSNYTVNLVNQWNETRSWHFVNCEFHQLGNADDATPTLPDYAEHQSNFSVRLDGVWDISFDGCDFTNTNYCVIIEDIDTTASKLTRMVTFRHCNFEWPIQQPETTVGSCASISSGSTNLTVANTTLTSANVGQQIRISGAGVAGGLLSTTIATVTGPTTGTVALAASTTVANATAIFGVDAAFPYGAIVLNKNVTIKDLTLDSCRFRVDNTTSGAWISEGGGAGTSASFERLKITNPFDYYGGTAHYAVRFTSSGTNNRLIDCDIDCDGFPVLVNGTIGGGTILREPGTISWGSGAAAGIELGATRPHFRSSAQFTGNLVDTNGNSIIGLSPAGSAVNYPQMLNAATGNSPELQANGSDTNVNLSLRPKGSGTIRLLNASGSVSLETDTNRNVQVGVGNPSTSATDGFLYIPSMNGVPSGVPTSKSGYAAFVYDQSSAKLMVYQGAWRGVTVA